MRAKLDPLYAIKGSHITVTAKELREIMLQTDGTIIVRGKIRTLQHKKLCPGVYRISLADDKEPTP